MVHSGEEKNCSIHSLFMSRDTMLFVFALIFHIARATHVVWAPVSVNQQLLLKENDFGHF